MFRYGLTQPTCYRAVLLLTCSVQLLWLHLQARCSTSTGAHLAQAAAQAVVDAALARGSMDNITALAMLYEWSA